MNKNILVLIGMMIVIAIVSALIAYFRAASLSTPEELASRGLSVIRRDRINFYGIFMPLVVGLISFYLFRFMQARWPESAQTTFLILAIGVGIAFTILATVVFKSSRGFVELLSLHVLYAAGFGWLMPVLFAK